MRISTCEPEWLAARWIRAAHRFARRAARLCRFDAVIDTVAEQMDERFLQFFDDRFIQLGVPTFGRQFHLFAQLFAKVARQAAEAAEGQPDREHARFEHLIAHFPGQAFDILGQAGQFRVFAPVG